MHVLPRLVFALVFVAGVSAARGEQRFQSTSTQVVLIELFTSEGCSSCPPAEKWLSALTNADGLWRTFVPVAFHVDYWDKLGWRDSFATRRATERQYEYAKLWGSRSVYTPCFVRNSREWSGDRNELNAPSRVEAGVLTLVLEADRVGKVEYTPVGRVEGGVEVTVALLGSGIVSPVRSGENAGRELQHDFSVLVFSQVPMEVSSEGRFSAQVILPKEPAVSAKRKAIAVWVSRRGTSTPLQATGGWLNADEQR